MKILLMYQPHPRHLAELEEVLRGRGILQVAHDQDEACRQIVDADAVLGNRYFVQALPFARRLQWMQSNSVGVDLILQKRPLLQAVRLTCSRGVYDEEAADHAVALVLALMRRIHLLRDEQKAHRWQRHSLPSLKNRRCLLLGWGGVARAIARRLRAFGVEIVAVRKRHNGRPREADGCLVCGPRSWKQFLPHTDLLIAALPLTPETRNIVDRPELRQLPGRAHVVNVGRGGTVNEIALLGALREERLQGAALDVTAQEPAPPDSPLWDEPKLLLTPHVARSQEFAPFAWEPLFAENLRRFVENKPLLNEVNIDAGY